MKSKSKNRNNKATKVSIKTHKAPSLSVGGTGRPRVLSPREEVIAFRLYTRHLKSAKTIAEELGVSSPTILGTVRRMGGEVRPRGRIAA